MASIDLLKKVIREEVRAVFQEELASILKEAIIANKDTRQLSEAQQVRRPNTAPGTLNTEPRSIIAPDLGKSNPLTNLLSETARSMQSGDMTSFGFSAQDAMGFGMAQREPQAVPSVNQMVASARPSSNMDMIEINDVPDFTQLMSNLKSKGAI